MMGLVLVLASILGDWKIDDYVVTVRQEENRVIATYNRISAPVTYSDGEYICVVGRWVIKATVDGDVMTGTYESDERRGTFTASRVGVAGPLIKVTYPTKGQVFFRGERDCCYPIEGEEIPVLWISNDLRRETNVQIRLIPESGGPFYLERGVKNRGYFYGFHAPWYLEPSKEYYFEVENIQTGAKGRSEYFTVISR
jgi:hypothetical protein